MQFSRNSRQLREVSACVASEDVSSSESYWTLSVSGLLQPRNESTSFSHLAPCFYHEWINLRFRGCGCGCGRSGCSSSGLGPLRFRSSCAVVFGDPTGSFLVVGPRAARARQLARAGVLPSSPCGLTLPMSVGLSSQSFLGFRVDPEPVSVSAASVKVAGVNRPVRNHTFSPWLALCFSFS